MAGQGMRSVVEMIVSTIFPDVNMGAGSSVHWGTLMDYNPGGVKFNRYANDEIGWETSYKMNVGFEATTIFRAIC